MDLQWQVNSRHMLKAHAVKPPVGDHPATFAACGVPIARAEWSPWKPGECCYTGFCGRCAKWLEVPK